MATRHNSGPAGRLCLVCRARARLESSDTARTFFATIQNKLVFAEDRAERRSTILMQEWVTQTDRFLAFDERKVLDGPGQVSADRMRVEVAGRYAASDEHRRAREAEDAGVEEADDIEVLLELERRRDPL